MARQNTAKLVAEKAAKRAAEILPDYEHRAGCPQRSERIELSKVRASGRLVEVARCCDCGAQRHETIEEGIARG